MDESYSGHTQCVIGQFYAVPTSELVGMEYDSDYLPNPLDEKTMNGFKTFMSVPLSDTYQWNSTMIMLESLVEDMSPSQKRSLFDLITENAIKEFMRMVTTFEFYGQEEKAQVIDLVVLWSKLISLLDPEVSPTQQRKLVKKFTKMDLYNSDYIFIFAAKAEEIGLDEFSRALLVKYFKKATGLEIYERGGYYQKTDKQLYVSSRLLVQANIQFIPKGISSLPDLRELVIDNWINKHWKIKEIPEGLNLKKLKIAKTEISKIPFQPELKSLYIAESPVTDISFITEIDSLEKLVLWDLPIQALPSYSMDSIKEKKLKVVTMGKTPQITSIPESWGFLPKLEEIKYEGDDNKLFIPTSIRNRNCKLLLDEVTEIKLKIEYADIVDQPPLKQNRKRSGYFRN